MHDKAIKFLERVHKFVIEKQDFLSYKTSRQEKEWPIFEVTAGTPKPIYKNTVQTYELSRYNEHRMFGYLSDLYRMWETFGPDEYKFKSYLYELVVLSAKYPQADVVIDILEGNVFYINNSSDYYKELISDRPTLDLMTYAYNLHKAIEKWTIEQEQQRLHKQKINNLIIKINENFSMEEQKDMINYFNKSK